jgi:hypothetical protein
MAGMGPPPVPDAQRRRRNATMAMTRLPAEGRKGPVPKWPLLPDIRLEAIASVATIELERLEALIDEGEAGKGAQAKATKLRQRIEVLRAQQVAAAKIERALWRELWHTPQAVAWERLRWTREVAQYVRWKAHAEVGDLDAAKEARQLADRLGLNPLAMLRLRWEIASDEVAEQRAQADPAGVRERLRAVE